MTIEQAIQQMRHYDRDFLIAIVIGLMFEDDEPVYPEKVLNAKNVIRMENMQELYLENMK